MNVADVRRLEALEMWIWRKVEKLTWNDGIRNEEVLKRVGEKWQLIDLIKK